MQTTIKFIKNFTMNEKPNVQRNAHVAIEDHADVYRLVIISYDLDSGNDCTLAFLLNLASGNVLSRPIIVPGHRFELSHEQMNRLVDGYKYVVLPSVTITVDDVPVM